MRHGWKIRIEERKYFEEKKQLREEKSAMFRLLKMQQEYEYRLRLQDMKENHEIN